MPYTYTPDVPQAATPMNVTQPQILENFQAIKELVSVNHVDFNLEGFGTHNVTMMPNTVAPTVPEPSGITMFTKITGSPNPSEIFGQYPSGSTFQISGISNTPGSVSGSSGTGWCQFTSGIIMMWGTGTTVPGTSYGYTFFSYVGTGIPLVTYVSFVKVMPTSSIAVSASFFSVSPAGVYNNFSGVPNGSFGCVINIQSQTGTPFNSAFPYSWFFIGN